MSNINRITSRSNPTAHFYTLDSSHSEKAYETRARAHFYQLIYGHLAPFRDFPLLQTVRPINWSTNCAPLATGRYWVHIAMPKLSRSVRYRESPHLNPNSFAAYVIHWNWPLLGGQCCFFLLWCVTPSSQRSQAKVLLGSNGEEQKKKRPT